MATLKSHGPDALAPADHGRSTLCGSLAAADRRCGASNGALMTLLVIALFAGLNAGDGQPMSADEPPADASAATVDDSADTLDEGSATAGSDSPESGTDDAALIPLERGASEPVETPPLPEWVTRGDYVEQGAEYRLVMAGPTYRLRDCERELMEAQLQAAVDYIGDVYGPEAARHVTIDRQYVRDHLVVPDRKHFERRQYQVGPMHTAYTQLRFDENFQTTFEQRWHETRARNRLVYTGVVGGSVLLLLTTVFGLIRLNHATRGFYAGRLQFLGAAAILALVAAGAVVLRGVPWL